MFGLDSLDSKWRKRETECTHGIDTLTSLQLAVGTRVPTQSSTMHILIERRSIVEISADAIILPVFEGDEVRGLAGTAHIEAGEITGRLFEFMLLHNPRGITALRLLLAGAGRSQPFRPAELGKLVGAAVRYLKRRSVRTIALVMAEGRDGLEWASAAVEGAILGDFELDRYKTSDFKTTVKSFTLVTRRDTKEIDEGANRGRILAEAQNFAREIVNEASNLKTSRTTAQVAREMATEYGLDFELRGHEIFVDFGMGTYQRAMQSNTKQPSLIVISYHSNCARANTHLGYVGKSITLNKDRNSLAYKMQAVKTDIAGGAAILGAMRAIAQFKPEICVTAFFSCVEQSHEVVAGGPPDLQTKLACDRTAHVDTEDQLSLPVALASAQNDGCTHIIGASMLTDTIGATLGHAWMGLFANNNDLRDRVLRAAEGEGEHMWHLPLNDDDEGSLNDSFIDRANGPYSMKKCAIDTPWVQLDIGDGTAWLDEPKPYICAGATGLPLKTLVRLATEWRD